MSSPAVTFVDVGHGDCTVAVDPENGDGLIIDCPSGHYKKALEELDSLGCTQLVAAIVTHTHDDHLGGVVEVLEGLGDRFTGCVYLNNDRLAEIVPAGHDAKDVAKRRRAVFTRIAEYGDRARAAETPLGGTCGRIAWRLHAPRHADIFAALGQNNVNVASGVVELEFAGRRVVVGGDAQIGTWDRIADAIQPGAVLRWPHHGGYLGAADADARLFAIAEPSVVIVSVGAVVHPGVPSEAFFDAAREHPSRLLCTQSTDACVHGGGVPGTCAGTMRDVLGHGDTVTTATDHEATMDALGGARCRLGPKDGSSE